MHFIFLQLTWSLNVSDACLEQVGDNMKSVESGWKCQQLCGTISHMCQITKIESV